MFCRKCGNEIINGSCFCDKCGAPVENGADNCQSAGPRMSKKEYFKSGFCSPQAAKKKKWSWIVFGIFTALTLISLIWNCIGLCTALAVVDFDGSIAEIMEDFSQEMGVNYTFTDEELESFDYLEQEAGVKVGTIFQIAFGLVLAGTIVFYAAGIILSLISIKKTSFGCALAALIVSTTCVGTLSAIVGTAILLFFTVKLNNEYKDYCNGMIFVNDNRNNGEPYFG